MINCEVSIESKSDEKAIQFRKMGNIFFVTKCHFDALLCYNRSISYANTKNILSLSYANRSTVYLKMKHYDQCLKNIQWARENDYPVDQLEALQELEQKCRTLKQQNTNRVNEDPWEFFKLSYPSNKNIPFIVDRLEVRTTEKYGRGIYATQDLKAGDIICIDEPVINFLEVRRFHHHCKNCFKTCMLNLIPCSRTGKFKYFFLIM